MTYTLASQKRNEELSLDEMRNMDSIPAVYYSAGSEATSIAVPRQEFIKFYKEAGETGIVTLEGHNVTCLVKDVQVHPVSHKLLHVDFLVVDMAKDIDVAVPLVTEGLSPIEDGGLGFVNLTVPEIEIRVNAGNIPSEFVIDVSVLDSLDKSIFAKDIALPEGATLLTDPDQLVVSVSAAKEEEEESAAEIDLDSIGASVEKGKKDKEEESTQ